MPSSTMKEIISLLPLASEEKLRALRTLIRAITEGGEDEDNLPAPPRRPGRPAKVAKPARRVSQETDDEEVAPRGRGRPRKEAAVNNSSRRGPGRPRKDDAPAKRGPGRPRKDDADNRPTARKAAAAAPAARNSGATDYSEMSKAQLRAAAEKIGLTGIKDANLANALIGIEKHVSGSKSVDSWERQATKANVELVFGRGRPPATEEGLKRRIIVKMVNERALRV